MPNVNPATPSPPPVPLTPVLSGAALRGGGAVRLRGLLDAPHQRHVTSGRIAIALALREIGVQPGERVLVPAYHSLSMIPPVLWRGATPVFYRLHADGMVDLDALEAAMQAGAKAMMLTHFFGFHQPLDAVRALCDRHGVALLEDCAHCLFGESAGQAVGSFGDYAIGSSMKFYPIYDGGCLVSHRHRLDQVRLTGAGLGFEAKAALNALEYSFRHGRLGWLKTLLALPLALRDRLWGALKARRPQGQAAALAPSSSDSSYEFDLRWIDKRASLFARLMLRILSPARISARRRAHYRQLQQALAGLPGCRPLHASLPEGVCPWLFPLWVDQPEALFATLCAERVPVVRFADTLWPGVDASVCANSVRLSRQVLALPCHQELRPAELAWIIERVRAALTP